MGSKPSRPKRKLSFRRLAKAVSSDHLLSLGKRNGFAPIPAHKPRYYGSSYTLPHSHDPYMTSSPYHSPLRQAHNGGVTMTSSGSTRMSRGSESTLGESGISSKASSSLDASDHSPPTSAPSSPQIVMRRKPPPKPPRMRSLYNDTPSPLDGGNGHITPSPSMRSTGVQSLKSSIADVTSSLDNTLTRSFDELDVDSSYNGSNQHTSILDRPSPTPDVSPIQEKVSAILAQTKQFLAFELEPGGVLHHMRTAGHISARTELDIRRCRSRHAACERMLDVMTQQGHHVFIAFCKALRTVGDQGYLADLLECLDSLVEVATANVMQPLPNGFTGQDCPGSPFMFHHRRPHGSQSGAPLAAEEETIECSLCSTNSTFDLDDIFGEDEGSFDIEICYVHRETGARKSVKDFFGAPQRRQRPLSVASEESVLLEENERYIPMISAGLFSQCLNNKYIHHIAYVLENYSCLRDLSIAKNHLGFQGMIRLGEALGRNRGLVKLDIRLNTIGDEGAMHLARGLRKHTALKVLNVASTGLTGTGCSHLMSGIIQSKTLTDLDLGFNELDDTACDAIGDALASNCSLRKLRMRSNSVRPYAARRVFKCLKRNAKLSLLDISCNKIGDESIALLADVLLYNRTLKEVNLENCNINREGCISLARALKTNTQLQSLDLSMNSVGDDGVGALAEGLKYNQALETLSLNMCSVRNLGFFRLLESMRHNVTLTTLKLCYNFIGQRNAPPLPNELQPSIVITNENGGIGHQDNPLQPTNGNAGSTTNGCGVGSGSNGEVTDESQPPIDELYDKLCQVLQLNKDLKVLLWGNKLEDDGSRTDQSIYNTPVRQRQESSV